MNESLICIDGVVGAGKTTLGELLSSHTDLHFFREPVDDNPLLEKFYHNRERYSFPTQIYFLNKRFRMLKEAEHKTGCIMDRSIYGDVIFARLLMMEGNMSKEEFNLYEELLFNMLEHVPAPRLMVWLDISVDNAVKRIRERGRDFEQAVDRSYWALLNEQYHNYFSAYNFSEILVIDVNDCDFRNPGADRDHIFSLIAERLAADKPAEVSLGK